MSNSNTAVLDSKNSASMPRIEEDLIPKKVRNRIRNASKREILSATYPYDYRMKSEVYEKQKESLQVELLKLQHWVETTGERVVMLFEGRDAAGKGGTIKRFMEHLNPRAARVVALGKPTEAERGQWYFQRYIDQLPTAGEIVLFDRSWYNRAVVEPVMGFCSSSQHHAFLRQVPMLENMLIDDGIRLFKFWFSVSREEQFRRFKARETDRLKQWKLSPVDAKGLSMWDEYTEAKRSMFMATDTTFSPWTVVRSDDKKRARLACMRYVLNACPYANKDRGVVGVPDGKIIGIKEDLYETDQW
ncbi:MAG: polyphosphate kinase 2 [Planctomycetota bacterium]